MHYFSWRHQGFAASVRRAAVFLPHPHTPKLPLSIASLCGLSAFLCVLFMCLFLCVLGERLNTYNRNFLFVLYLIFYKSLYMNQMFCGIMNFCDFDLVHYLQDVSQVHTLITDLGQEGRGWTRVIHYWCLFIRT